MITLTPHADTATAAGAATPAVTLTLPTPPSINAMFVNRRKGRAKSPAYQDWLSHAGWVLKSQHPPPISGAVLAIVNIERGSNRADLDNRIKALFDLLVTHGVIEDDSQIAAFAAAWLSPANGQTHIALYRATPIELSFLPSANGAGGGWFHKSPPLQP